MPRTRVYRANWRCLLLGVSALSIAPLAGQLAAMASDDSPGEAEAASATYQLAYKFQEGDVWRYVVSHDASLTTQKGAAAVTAVQTSKSWKHYRVVAVKDGAATIEPTIDRVRVKIRSEEQDGVEYDSSSDKAPPAALRRLAKSIGRPLSQVQVESNGDLISARSLLPQGDARASASGSPGSQDDADANFLVVFPDGPVQVGESWKDQIKVSVWVDRTLSKPVILRRTYTLQSVSGDLATIALRTSVLTLIQDPRLQSQLIQRKPRGTIVFDMKQGRIVSRELQLDHLVVGFSGSDSKMRAVSHRVERLTSSAAVAVNSRQPVEAKRQR